MIRECGEKDERVSTLLSGGRAKTRAGLVGAAQNGLEATRTAGRDDEDEPLQTAVTLSPQS